LNPWLRAYVQIGALWWLLNVALLFVRQVREAALAQWSRTWLLISFVTCGPIWPYGMFWAVRHAWTVFVFRPLALGLLEELTHGPGSALALADRLELGEFDRWHMYSVLRRLESSTAIGSHEVPDVDGVRGGRPKRIYERMPPPRPHDVWWRPR
jgi:hypothetical protein